MIKLLFLDSTNSCESQIAEGLARAVAPKDVEVVSAGLDPDAMSRDVVSAMKSKGIDISDHKSKGIDGFDDGGVDVIVTIGDEARHNCPLLPGTPAVINWDIAGDTLETRAERIQQLVDALFSGGFLGAFFNQRHNFLNIMGALPVGLIVHGMDRNIAYMSPKAEAITGFSQAEAVGKDCNEVFNPGICGPNCMFCDTANPKEINPARYTTSLLTRDGQRKDIEVSVVPLADENKRTIGVVAALADQTDLRKLEREVNQTYQFSGIIGQDHKMQMIYDLIISLAESDFPVVIMGDSGTGKELVAHAIHNESPRKDKLFVPINCGALPEGTIESELFGHVKGAFTGAIRDKKGRFALADGGTIFLDEVAELSPAMQVKILRVLQEKTFEPVGSETTLTVDVRVISATNKNLRELVKKGTFRDDLYYRLAVVPIELPPLRERRNDIPLLANHFLKSVTEKLGRSGMEFSPEAMSILMSYSWPGNIRQLQNAIQFSMIKCRSGAVRPEHLPPELTGGFGMPEAPVEHAPGKAGRKPKLSIDTVEYALKKTAGNKAKAARVLGVGRATLYNFLEGHPELETVGEVGP